MELLRDADIDPAPLAGKRVAIIGYGNQGRAQALNLQGQRRRRRRSACAPARSSAAVAEALGLARRCGSRRPSPGPTSSCCSPPTKSSARSTREIEPHLRQGAALGFTHGLAIRFGLIAPRADLDVFLVAPKGPGTALRTLYTRPARA